MENIIEAIVGSGGYAALCVLLVLLLRETNVVIRENTAAITALKECLKGE